MSDRKEHLLPDDHDSDSNHGPPTKKRMVQKQTVQKWTSENDAELNTIMWLKFKMADLTMLSQFRVWFAHTSRIS